MDPKGQSRMTRARLRDMLNETGLNTGDYFTDRFVNDATARIESTDGSKYYDPNTDTMLFETMPIGELVRYADEEILDIPNYAVMLAERGVAGAEDLVEGALFLRRALFAMADAIETSGV